MKSKNQQSEASFNAGLKARLGGAVASTAQMHMTPAPVGASKSLAEMLADEPDAKADDTVVRGTGKQLLESASVPTQSGTELALPPGQAIRKIALHLVVDSPWQPRQRYDETGLINLADELKSRGQEEPVRMRPLPGGKFQLIAGHRRTRAARLIGWAEIDAIVVDLNDRDAKYATLISNESNEGLSDYERALLYQELVTDGYAATQKEVAVHAKRSAATVSNIMALLKLPAPILELQAKYPRLLTSAHAKAIQKLLERFPDDLDAIMVAVERRIDDPELEPAAMVEFAERQLGKKRPRRKLDNPFTIQDKNGRTAFSVRVKDNQMVITAQAGVDLDKSSKRAMAALREFAQNLELSDETAT